MTTHKQQQLNAQLRELRKEQVTDIYADFPTRIGRYVRIKLIEYLLNKFQPYEKKKQTDLTQEELTEKA